MLQSAFRQATLLIVLFPFVATADDAPMDIRGETVVPIRDSSIQLVSETVLIDTSVSLEDRSESATRHSAPRKAFVKATLTFFNHERNEKTILMAFPIPEDIETVYANAGKLNFNVTANGKAIATRMFQEKGSSSRWFVWKQLFPSDRAVVMVNSYSAQFGSNHVEPGAYNFHYFRYILTTGALWSEEIDHAYIRVEFEAPLNLEWLHVFPAPTSKTPDSVEWTFSHFKPTEDIRMYYSWNASSVHLKTAIKNFDSSLKDESKAICKEVRTLGPK